MPSLVQGSAFNIKVTRAEDLDAAARILERRGDSNDARKCESAKVSTCMPSATGDHVVLGGVRIAHTRGVVAHSDGDVIIHALCDALLGALGEGDIGQHFPDTDPRYRGADSRAVLARRGAMMREVRLCALVNADLTVLAEAPRIAAHRAAMAANLAADLGVAAQLHQYQGDHHRAHGIRRAR